MTDGSSSSQDLHLPRLHDFFAVRIYKQGQARQYMWLTGVQAVRYLSRGMSTAQFAGYRSLID